MFYGIRLDMYLKACYNQPAKPNFETGHNMSIVSVRKTEDYGQDTLDRAVAKHFDALKIADDLRPGMKVTVKPNLLTARRPNQAVTTHPNLILAVAKWLRERGVDDITVADSPAGPYHAANLRTVYGVSGMNALEGAAKLNYDTGWKEITCPEGFRNRSFNIINPIADADYIINVAKLKTHSMTTMSGGIKNMFGSIPGLQKPEMHYKYPKQEDFANMLLELAGTVRPNVTVIDAVEAMEGNGPNSGDRRFMGFTLASRDVFAQDYIAAGMMGIEPKTVPMLELAVAKGLFSPSDITVTGDGAQTNPKPFKLPDSKKFLGFLPNFMRGPVSKGAALILKPLPHLTEAKCIGCGKCAESCPPHLIKIAGGKARIPQKGCISCFCCQEVCPAHAIEVRRRLGKTL